MKFLVIDDNPGIRKTIKKVLSEREAVILECCDGTELLDAYETFRPDIVITDIQMPVMDGISATSVLKQHYPDARVIVLTSYKDKDLVLHAISSGADAYVLKEEIVKLYEYINPLLSNNRNTI